ncbi:hypothetical protein ACVWW3_003130 [Bradyrhizobium sp. LM2.9]
MSVTVFVRYQLDPFKRAQFEEYSKRWLTIIPKCGGDLIGYFMPHEGTNNIAFALISFESLGRIRGLSRPAASGYRRHGKLPLRRGAQIHPRRRAHVFAPSDLVGGIIGHQ